MPNGWYPVPGLDVVLINRSEQRYPRIEWDQSWNRLWAIYFTGPNGFAPQSPIRFAPAPGQDPARELVRVARELVAAESMQGTAGASVLHVDFAGRRGFACGAFSVYAFRGGAVECLLDLTLGAELPAEQRGSGGPPYLGYRTTGITTEGLQPTSRPFESFQFRFDDVDALVVSSMPLHYDAHWPPKNALDCVAIALASERRFDILVALWQRPPVSA